jgi:hypothetical protein|tara:strand:- start:360 stop:1085 length:726 start_codon:yes stop_codon:yes gene_type:complete
MPPDSVSIPETAQSILLEVVGASTPNYTLDFQGKTHASGTFTNVDYIQTWQAGVATFSNSQLTVNDTTRRFYVVPVVAPFMQAVATRTGGNLTIHGSFSSQPWSQWLPTLSTGALATTTASPGASEVIAVQANISSSTRATLATPTAGTKARIVSVILMADHATVTEVEVYFDTGANITSDGAKAIFMAQTDTDSGESGGWNPSIVFPDGAGPVGAVNDVISVRVSADGTGTDIVAHYREE